MKISEIEEQFCAGNFSEQLFSEFQIALKRVPKNLRSQHCYTTAYSMRETDAENAERLLLYGLEHCENDWVDLLCAYQNLGAVYECHQQYEKAKCAYQSALNSVPKDQKSNYAPSVSMHILRVALHCSHFTYTDEIEALFALTLQETDFGAAFRHFVFYRSLAAMLVAKHISNREQYNQAFDAATAALNGADNSFASKVLRRHRYKDETHATKEAMAFLRKSKRL